MYNRFSPPNQSAPNAQRNYPYGPPPGPPGPPYQPTQQAQQHSPAVLQHGLSTHNNASQFSNFNPYSNSSRMNSDLRGGYGAHLGSHQPQQPQPTHIQSWPTNKNTWSTDLGVSGSTNSTTNHSSMLTGSIYGNNGQSGSNTGAFAQTGSPSLFSTTTQQQQQQSPQQTRRIQQQTMANRLSGDSHAFGHQSSLGAHNQQSPLTSLASFHTSPTPAAQTQTHSTHNNNNNSNMLSLPTPNSSSATLMRQGIYHMDTNSNMNNMSSLSSIGNMAIGLNNVGFQRPAMSVNDPTNINTFVEVDTTPNEIDAESLIDNSLVTSSSLPSNTPSAQASISPSNQQNYMGNNNINNRYPQSQHTTPTQIQRQPQRRYNPPSSSTSPNTSISSITDSSSGHSSSASVNNSTNKRSSADSGSVYNTPNMTGMAQRNPNVNYNNINNYIMSGQSGQPPPPSYPNQQAAQQQQQTPQQSNVTQNPTHAQQRYSDFISSNVGVNYSQQNASSATPQQQQQSQQQQIQLQHQLQQQQQNQTHQQASRSPYSYTTSPHLQSQHMHPNQANGSISSPRIQKSNSKKSSGMPNQGMPPPQLHSQPSQIQQQAQQTPSPMHQHNQMHQQQQNQSQQQMRHQPPIHQQQQQQQQQLQQPPQQQQTPQLQQLQHGQPIQHHHLPQQTQQTSDSQIQMQHTTPKPMGRVINQQQQPSSFPSTNVQNTPKSAKITTVTPASSNSAPRTNNNINNNINNNNINNNNINNNNINNTSSLPPQENSSDIPTGLPPQKEHKPKRPMNAFILFSSERRPELQKNDPNMQTAQVSKILGEEWQNMDPARKDHYNARARQLKEDFKQSNPDFVYTRRGSSNSAKKRPPALPITTVSTSSNNKPQPDPIAVPPQSSSMPIQQNDSLNGVVPQQHASNTYTSSPHQHPPSSTPQRNSPAINRQNNNNNNNNTPSLPPTQPPQQRSTPQQAIGASSSSTSTSTPTTTPNRKDNKLKRPMNAFLIFNKEMRPKVLEMNPNMTVAEISKTIGENWRGMTEEQRDQYLQKARELKNEFHETHPDFVYTRRSKAELAAAGHHSYSKKRHFNRDDSDSDDDQNTQNNNNNNNNHREGSPAHSPLKDPRGRKKKRSRHPTAPKHPMSGFLFYALEMRPHVAEQNPGSTVGPISKIIASHWKNLTPEQRERWEKMASDDKARYAREMEAYLQDQKENE